MLKILKKSIDLSPGAGCKVVVKRRRYKWDTVKVGLRKTWEYQEKR